MFYQKRESKFVEKFALARRRGLFSCDLDVEKASVVITANGRNLVKGDCSRAFIRFHWR